ncbi:MAG: hypothetical protein K0U98_15660 [Deltaproteobacteria bacterium]|nr:hypothetical protein [Deltaproteobacteria bacterium]
MITLEPHRWKSQSLFGGIVILALLLPGFAAPAQIAEPVIDLFGEGLVDVDNSSFPNQFTRLGNRVVFFASSLSSGSELWVTDGTPLGTTLLVDSCPGPCNANPSFNGRLGDVLFFVSETDPDSTDLTTLWRTDGTVEGTFPLPATRTRRHDIAGNFVALGEALLFGRRDEEGIWGLWRSDGTIAGTNQLTEFAPSAERGLPLPLVSLEDRLYFFQAGNLWSSDGTGAGTVLEADLTHFDSLGSTIYTADQRIFFRATDSQGEALWTVDPASGEVSPVMTFFQTSGPELRCVGTTDGAPDRLFFQVDDFQEGITLWQTQGTPASTRQLARLGPQGSFLDCPSSDTLQVFENSLVFTGLDDGEPALLALDEEEGSLETLALLCARESSCGASTGQMARFDDQALFSAWHPEAGLELWSTDGTREGTGLFMDLCAGACDSWSVIPRPIQGVHFFQASDHRNRQVIWRTDGTQEGTLRAITAPLTQFVHSPHALAWLDDRFIFAALNQETGFEPWVSTGTAAGTRLLRDINPLIRGSELASLTPAFDGLIFSANTIAPDFESLVRNLWSSRGGAGDTIQLTDFSNDRSLDNVVAAGDLIFFDREAADGGREITRSDGTVDGTFPLHLFEAAGSATTPQLSEVAELSSGQRFFLVRREGDSGVWTTDGTTVQRTVDFASLGIAGHQHTWKTGDRLYFTAETDSLDSELFATDGTPAGTTSLTTTDSLERITGFQPLGAETLFLKGDCSGGSDLWRTRGTADSTQRIDLDHRFGCTAIEVEMVRFGEDLYFVEAKVDQLGAPAGVYLWRTDGTSAGTQAVAELPSSSSSATSHHLTATPSALFLTPVAPATGQELWVSDGTSEGTVSLKQFPKAVGSPHIEELTAAGNRLYFTADDGVHGSELWTTDGTVDGTRLVHDIYPEGQSSRPEHLTVVGNTLYFSADDGLSGRELWALPLDASGPPCQASQTALCLQGGRFKTELKWRGFSSDEGAGTAVAITQDTGYFWFNNDQNVEAVVKVLDGQEVNGHHWFFYGGLSSFRYWITVTDTETGLSRRYLNRSRNLQSFGDPEAFGPLGVNLVREPNPVASDAPQPLIVDGQIPQETLGEGCTPAATRLCLNQGRFAVEATWTDFSGHSGTGKAVTLTEDTGYFWFFRDTNIETVLKVLDGRSSTGAFWVFYGSLSNVDFDLTVTDTQTGAVRTYQNRNRQFASVADTEAFPQ